MSTRIESIHLKNKRTPDEEKLSEIALAGYLGYGRGTAIKKDIITFSWSITSQLELLKNCHLHLFQGCANTLLQIKKNK